MIGATLLAGSAQGQPGTASGDLSEIDVAGGLPPLLTAVGDRLPPDRAQFLVDFIRRTHNAPPEIKSLSRDALLQSVRTYFADRVNLPDTASRETLPLPFSVRFWIDVVFKGRATPQTLLGEILQSRDASLLYYGLLSLDAGTRGWLAAQPELVADLALRYSAPFVIAAPAIRVKDGVIVPPGGDAAAPVWEGLVGRKAKEPVAFVRALLAHDEGRLAYFFGAIADLTPGQATVALTLDLPDVGARLAAARRLYAVFEAVASSWRIGERIFWRPALDPALLLADLPVDPTGRPVLPGNKRFWTAVFAEVGSGGKSNAPENQIGPGLEPGDFAWLCEQVFTPDRNEQRRRYQSVLFASRIASNLTAGNIRDAIEAVRAVQTCPALMAALEQAKLADIAAYARAARRAATLTAIGDHDRAERALGQFQGALSLLTRAARRGGLQDGELARLVSSLSALELTDRGDYDGRVMRWLSSWMHAYLRDAPEPAEMYAQGAGRLETAAIAILAGPSDDPRQVEWEGTRYRLNFARAEAIRIARLIGENPRPFLSSAESLVDMSDALADKVLTRDRLRELVDAFAKVAGAVGWDEAELWEEHDVRGRSRDASAALQRAKQDGDVRGASRLAPVLRELADDLLARGLMEAAYAVALGQAERAPISADDAATRHDFGVRTAATRRMAPWAFPGAMADSQRGWHMTGSLLTLDVRLADFLLTRVSSRPQKPMLDDDQRRTLVDAVALIDPLSLRDSDGDAIVQAIRKGRTRLQAIKTAADANAVADQTRLSPSRRSLLLWIVSHDAERTAAFFSVTELLWLGLGSTPGGETFNAWGATAEPRLGCLCLRFLDRRPWESFAGRWHSGIFMSGFADLNLRLAEILADLHMPAAILAPVLAPATLELIENTITRDHDDRRGFLEFVNGLRPARVEQYLALLTSDGPLVPIETGSSR